MSLIREIIWIGVDAAVEYLDSAKEIQESRVSDVSLVQFPIFKVTSTSLQFIGSMSTIVAED